MLKALDLFSGIGGISVALGDYARTIGYVEIDKYAQSVLLSRMLSGDIETAPIFRDITRLDGTKLRGSVDLICGGFPCQDLSVAGRGKGLAGERSGLFFEIIRLVKEISPRFVFLENVPAIRIRGLSEVVNAFTEIGYDCRWTCISASDVGANHKRERWFLLAHPNGNKLRNKSNKLTERESSPITSDDGSEKLMGYSKHNGQFAAEKPRSDGTDNKEESPREIGSSQLKRASEHREVQGNFPDLADPGSERLKTREIRELGKTYGEEKGAGDKFAPTAECICTEISDSMCEGLERHGQKPIGIKSQLSDTCFNSDEISHPNSDGFCQQTYAAEKAQSERWSKTSAFDCRWWSVEPDVGRVVNGLPNRVDRIKCLGNSVVPLQVKTAFERLIGYASIQILYL